MPFSRSECSAIRDAFPRRTSLYVSHGTPHVVVWSHWELCSPFVFGIGLIGNLVDTKYGNEIYKIGNGIEQMRLWALYGYWLASVSTKLFVVFWPYVLLVLRCLELKYIYSESYAVCSGLTHVFINQDSAGVHVISGVTDGFCGSNRSKLVIDTRHPCAYRLYQVGRVQLSQERKYISTQLRGISTSKTETEYGLK